MIYGRAAWGRRRPAFKRWVMLRLGDMPLGSHLFSEILGISDNLLDLLNHSPCAQDTTGDTVGESDQPEGTDDPTYPRSSSVCSDGSARARIAIHATSQCDLARGMARERNEAAHARAWWTFAHGCGLLPKRPTSHPTCLAQFAPAAPASPRASTTRAGSPARRMDRRFRPALRPSRGYGVQA
jgi:hypothetical protein